MTEEPRKYKALSLFSGGLDSQLAVCVLREQGIHVEAITFRSPFFSPPSKALKAAAALGVRCHVVDFTADILELLRDPPHGFGSAINPCIDCHARMIQRAGELLEEWDFDFIATGEVLAQRPMSQNKQSLGVVARSSGYEDLVVRPLSAPLLPPTRPIREGWVDVSRLPAFSGRNRKPQMELAEKFGLKDYPGPAGGCLLTERQFAVKVRDLLDHEGPDEDFTNVWLLRIGRHFRLGERTKIIVGTNQADNERLRERARPEDLRLHCAQFPGPVVIAPAHASPEELRRAAAICARYAKTPPDAEEVEVRVLRGKEEEPVETLRVRPFTPEEVEPFRIG